MTDYQSPLRHDYKPAPGSKGRRRPVGWFAAGLCIPLAALALIAFAPSLEATQKPKIADAVVVTQPVTLPDTITEIPASHAAAEDDFALTLTISSGDTLDELFKEYGLNRGHLLELLQLPDARKHLRILRPGDEIRVRHTNGNIDALSREISESETLVVERRESGFASRIDTVDIERRTVHAHAVIDSSLFLAALDAGVTETLTMNLAGIFAWDIDFVLDIRQGDEFIVVYEELWRDGQKLRDGDIVAAEFINRGKSFRAVRFKNEDGKVGYFTPEGHNVKKAFIRAPIAFTPRVTSRFNPNRKHPVLNKRRPHRGVDYGAPTGTPIKAAGDGKVIHRGKKGGYGNTVILQHGGNITTLYAHMSKFARSAGHGKRVKQGQTIGYVGSTGLSSGPHLHYEYRVNGVHRNPRTVKLPQAAPIERRFRDDFEIDTAPLLSRLDLIKRTQLAALSP